MTLGPNRLFIKKIVYLDSTAAINAELAQLF